MNGLHTEQPDHAIDAKSAKPQRNVIVLITASAEDWLAMGDQLTERYKGKADVVVLNADDMGSHKMLKTRLDLMHQSGNSIQMVVFADNAKLCKLLGQDYLKINAARELNPASIILYTAQQETLDNTAALHQQYPTLKGVIPRDGGLESVFKTMDAALPHLAHVTQIPAR